MVGRRCQDQVPRMVVIADGDGLIPGTMDEKAEKLQELCRTRNVPCHITRKREKENYITDRALQSWSNASTRHIGTVNTFVALKQSQKDHYDMKIGFRDKTDPAGVKIPSVQAVLFSISYS